MNISPRHALLVACLFASAAPATFAQVACPCGGGTRVTGPALVNLLAGRTVCGTAGGDQWQEFHSGATANGGPLIDWKLGPGHPVDPTTQVGTWSIADVDTANTIAIYNYGSGGTYGYAVCLNGATVNFCGSAGAPRNARTAATAGTDVLNATLIAGQASCGATRSKR